MIEFERKRHWENIYANKAPEQLGWHQPVPEVSLSFIDDLNLPKEARIIDVGGGDSYLVDNLIDLGYTNLTIVDISEAALVKAKQRLGKKAEVVNWIVEDVIDFLDLQHYRDQLIQNLPYGVRKIVELGRALCTGPKLLLLDEPASGLNVDETEDMSFWIDDIKKLLGITVIMVEHNMRLVSQVSDHVLAINYGETLANGSPREVQENPDVIKAYLGEEKDAG